MFLSVYSVVDIFSVSVKSFYGVCVCRLLLDLVLFFSKLESSFAAEVDDFFQVSNLMFCLTLIMSSVSCLS